MTNILFNVILVLMSAIFVKINYNAGNWITYGFCAFCLGIQVALLIESILYNIYGNLVKSVESKVEELEKRTDNISDSNKENDNDQAK